MIESGVLEMEGYSVDTYIECQGYEMEVWVRVHSLENEKKITYDLWIERYVSVHYCLSEFVN